MRGFWLPFALLLIWVIAPVALAQPDLWVEIIGPTSVCPDLSEIQYTAILTSGHVASPSFDWTITGDARFCDGGTTAAGEIVCVNPVPGCDGAFLLTVVVVSGEDFAECLLIVEVDDDIPPEIVCPPDATFECPEDVITEPPGVSDDCDPDVSLTSSQSLSDETFATVAQVTQTATDRCGNAADCLQLVTIWKPDLAIPAINANDVLIGIPVTIGATVSNPASGAVCGPVAVSFYVSGELIDTQVRAGFAPFEAAVFSTNYIPPAAGDYTASVEVDAGPSVVEVSSENNVGLSGFRVEPLSTLPVPPVVERFIAPAAASGGDPAESSGLLIQPWEAWTHRDEIPYRFFAVEFFGYEETRASDPSHFAVAFSPALAWDRGQGESFPWPLGQRFPLESSAVFEIDVRNASGETVGFASPVNITVQFLYASDELMDVRSFDGSGGYPSQMRVVRDVVPGMGVDFEFVEGEQFLTLGLGEIGGGRVGTVRLENSVDLSDTEDGRGVWGVIVNPTVPPSELLTGQALR